MAAEATKADAGEHREGEEEWNHESDSGIE